VVHGRRCNPRAPKPLKIQVFKGSPSPQGSHSTYILWDTTRPRHITQTYNICPNLIEIGAKTAQKKSAQTNKPTDTTKIMVTWPLGHKAKMQQKTTSHFCRIGTQWVMQKIMLEFLRGDYWCKTNRYRCYHLMLFLLLMKTRSPATADRTVRRHFQVGLRGNVGL